MLVLALVLLPRPNTFGNGHLTATTHRDHYPEYTQLATGEAVWFATNLLTQKLAPCIPALATAAAAGATSGDLVLCVPYCGCGDAVLQLAQVRTRSCWGVMQLPTNT